MPRQLIILDLHDIATLVEGTPIMISDKGGQQPVTIKLDPDILDKYTTSERLKKVKEYLADEVVGDYFKQMNRDNGWSMAYTMTQEFFGIDEDELTGILDELGIEDES